MKSNARISYVQVMSTQENAMDKKILQDLRAQTNSDKKSEYFIISNDNDYAEETDKMVRGGLKICRSSDIAAGSSVMSQILNVRNNQKSSNSSQKNNVGNNQKSSNSAKKNNAGNNQKSSNSAKKNTASDKERKRQRIRSFLGNELQEYRDNWDDICDIIMHSKTKTQVHCELQKKFKDISYLYGNIDATFIYRTIQPIIQNMPGK